MSVDLATLAIRVDGETATQQVIAFGAASEHSIGHVVGFEHAVEGLEKTLGHVRTALGLGLFGLEFAKATIDAQNSMAQLEAGVRSTGGAAGFTAEQLRKQAFEMEELSTNTHVAVERTQGILLLFQRLSGENFERATQSALDLAARLGTDAPDAARQLGRALEDPKQGLEALRRAGVVFTEGQKEMIKSLQLAGKEEEAQAFILDELQRKLGGSAAAARDTLGGALKGVAHEFENLFEVSRGGTGILISALDTISHGLKFLRENTEAVSLAFQVFVGSIIAKNLTTLVNYNTSLRAARVATIEAAEAEVMRTQAMVVSRVEAQEMAALELKVAQERMANAVIYQNLAADEWAIVAANQAMTVATVQLTAAEEAELAATLALTEAQVAEGIAVTTLARVTSVAAGIMAAAGEIAAVAWKAIGGWIGAIIIAAIALNAWLDKYLDKQVKSAEQTDAQREATEKALKTERDRNAAIRRHAEDEENARIAATKANAERDVATNKLHAMNEAYRQNALTLKILEIQESANIEKVKAHKDVRKDEWAAIDQSIDRQAHEQIVAAQRADKLQREISLRTTQREAMITVRDATESLHAKQMEVDHYTTSDIAKRKIDFDLQTAMLVARLDFAEKTKNATKDQTATAQAEYDATVKRAQATHDLSVKELDLVDILTREGEQLKLNAQYARDKDDAFERGLKEMKEADRLAQETKDRVTGMITQFFDAAKNGASGFWESFKLAAERTFAELATKKLAEKLMSIDELSGLFDRHDMAEKDASGISRGSMTEEMWKQSHPDSKMVTGIKGAAQGIAMVGSAFTTGSMAGGLTTNRALGAWLGMGAGSMTGAAMGATMGGPFGAVAGAIIGAGAGLVGGFMGAQHASERLAAELKRQEMAHAQIEQSLASWRAQITGTAEDQKRANEADLRWKYLSLIQTIEQVEAGKKMEEQRNKDLKEAADLYEMAQKKLTDTTNTLNAAFTGMINAVSGYKLNLALFNYSPALGPNETNLSAGGAGSSSSGNSGSSSGNGSGEFSQPLNVNLVVDGKTLAKVTVNHFRKVAQAQLGSSDQILEAMALI